MLHMVKQKRHTILWLVPVGMGVLAHLFFFLQGGFGAGHGILDLVIFLTMLPSILILPLLPRVSLLERSDLLMIIWLPMLVNVVVSCVAQFILNKRRG